MDWLARFQPLWIFLLSALIAVVAWSLRKSMATKEDLQKRDAAFEALDRRVLTIENTLEGLPERADFERLGRDIQNVQGDMKAFQAELHGVRELFKRAERQLNLISEHLLDKER